MYLLLYVDDILVTISNMSEIEKVKWQSSFKYDMKDLRVSKRIFKIKIIRDKSSE